MNWFKYVVIWWSDIEENDLTAYGITSGESYTEAMKHIEDHFGNTLESVEHLEMISDNCSCYDLDKDQYYNIGDNF